MGLLEDLQNTPTKERSCTVHSILSSISLEERKALLTAIERVKSDERSSRAKQYSCQWLADVLASNGYNVSRSTVSRHINGECSCEFTG